MRNLTTSELCKKPSWAHSYTITELGNIVFIGCDRFMLYNPVTKNSSEHTGEVGNCFDIKLIE